MIKNHAWQAVVAYRDDVFGTDIQIGERGISLSRQHRQRRRCCWWNDVRRVVVSQAINVSTPSFVRHQIVASRRYQRVPRYDHVVGTNVGHVHVRHARRCNVTWECRFSKVYFIKTHLYSVTITILYCTLHQGIKCNTIIHLQSCTHEIVTGKKGKRNENDEKR